MKMFKSLVFVVGTLAASLVAAQGAGSGCENPALAKSEFVAELHKVVGNVLVSDSAGMTSGVDKQQIKNAMRVTTTSRASVTVSFACGCDVQLKENERLDITTPNSCATLVAAVQAVPVSVAIGATAAPAVARQARSTRARWRRC